MDMVNLNEAAYWLALVNSSELKLGQIKPIAQRWHLMEGKSIAQLFNLSVTDLGTRFSLTEGQARQLLKAADTHNTHLTYLKQWQAQGIQLLTLNHPHYPTRLIYTLPPRQQPLLLWAKGDTQLLSEPTITILGKPDPDPETVAFVNNLVTMLVEEKIGVVSGYGKGLDRTAFETMIITENGYGVAVLPMGLTAFAKLTSKLDESIKNGQTLLLSPFAPDIAYKENFAEARNMLVDSLALALLVPQVDVASQPRAEAALARGLPVLVDMTDSPENRALIANGAFLMTDPGEVIDMVQQEIIDDTLQAQIAQAPASEGQPPPSLGTKETKLAPLLDDEDDYALGTEIAEPLDADEALDILSSMGNVPDSLRARLMAIEAQRKQEKKE